MSDRPTAGLGDGENGAAVSPFSQPVQRADFKDRRAGSGRAVEADR